jgi:hypothetical protein
MKTTSWLLMSQISFGQRTHGRACASRGRAEREHLERSSTGPADSGYYFFSAFGAVSAVRGFPVRIPVLPSYSPRTCGSVQRGSVTQPSMNRDRKVCLVRTSSGMPLTAQTTHCSIASPPSA